MRKLTVIRIYLLCTFCFCVFGLSAQETYYSKMVGQWNQFTRVYDAIPLEDGKAILSIYNLDYPTDYSHLGWIVIDQNGNTIDSFFYKQRRLLSVYNHSMLLLGDTVIQVTNHIQERHLVSINGSSLSNKDSLFRWQIDFSEIPTLDLVLGHAIHLNERGNLVIVGKYNFSEPGNNRWVLRVFMLEITLQGEVILNTIVNEIREYSNSALVRVTSQIFETEDAYIFIVLVNNRAEQYHIYRTDKNGNLLLNIQQDDRGSNTYCDHTGQISDDNSSIYLAIQGKIDFSKYEDHVADSLYDLYGLLDVIRFREYDLLTGQRLQEIEYPIFSATAVLTTNFSLKSSVTNEIIFGGSWREFTNRILYQSMLGKVTLDGEFTLLKKVKEDFGHPLITGAYIFGGTELSNGDLLFIGSILNGSNIVSGQAGWILKLPPSICHESIYCEGDVLSINTIRTSTKETAITQIKKIMLHPNPVATGQTLYLSELEDRRSSTGTYRVRLLDLQGRTVHTGTVYAMGSQEPIPWQVPQVVISGVYLLEIADDNGVIGGGKVVIHAP
jgi:hypothetical protein